MKVSEAVNNLPIPPSPHIFDRGIFDRCATKILKRINRIWVSMIMMGIRFPITRIKFITVNKGTIQE
jgi:hypothetical protein